MHAGGHRFDSDILHALRKKKVGVEKIMVQLHYQHIPVKEEFFEILNNIIVEN